MEVTTSSSKSLSERIEERANQKMIKRETKQRISVSVLEIKDLQQNDTDDESNWNSWNNQEITDVYCSVTIGKKKFKNGPRSRNRLQWNDSPFIFSDSADLNDHIRVRLKGRTVIGTVCLLGEVNILLLELPSTTDKREFSFSHVLGHQTRLRGKVVLQLQYEHTQNSPEKAELTSSAKSAPTPRKGGQIVPTMSDGIELVLPEQKEVTKDSSADSKNKRKNSVLRAIKASKTNRADKKNQSYRKLFSLPEGEVLLWDYSAALLKHMLHHGRLYFSQRFVCFYSNLFGIKVVEAIPIGEITSVEKESKIIVNPGITIRTANNEFHFASFLNREKVYSRIIAVWKQSSAVEAMSVDDADILDEEEIQEGMNNEEDDLTGLLSTEEDKDGNFLLLKDQLHQVASGEFPVSVVTFFTMIFSDESDFEKIYHNIRGDKELVIEKWSSHPQYGNFRTISYRAPVHMAIGPSTTRLEETQRYHLQKDHLVVQTVSVMHDIPYGDYFHVEFKHELTAVGEDRCKVVSSVGVNFTKKTFFEGKIKSGVMKETKDSFESWIVLANDEIKKKKNKRKLTKSGNRNTEEKDKKDSPPPVHPHQNLPAEKTHVSGKKHSAKSQYRALFGRPPPMILAVFILLVLIMGALFVQIILLTDRVSELEEKLDAFVLRFSQPRTPEEHSHTEL